MHKIPSGARFIIAGKKCFNRQLNKHVTSAFKLCYSQIDAYKKNYLLVKPKLPSFRMYQKNQQKKKC